jgi:hypothetical protein
MKEHLQLMHLQPLKGKKYLDKFCHIDLSEAAELHRFSLLQVPDFFCCCHR